MQRHDDAQATGERGSDGASRNIRIALIGVIGVSLTLSPFALPFGYSPILSGFIAVVGVGVETLCIIGLHRRAGSSREVPMGTALVAIVVLVGPVAFGLTTSLAAATITTVLGLGALLVSISALWIDIRPLA